MNNIADSIIAATAPREERIKFEGHELVVREVENAADTAAFREGKDNMLIAFTVASVFDANGQPVFSTDHIPALKSRAKTRFFPLFKAVSRVNGLDIEHEEKNSEASPSA
jgi:hypothetical protein